MNGVLGEADIFGVRSGIMCQTLHFPQSKHGNPSHLIYKFKLIHFPEDFLEPNDTNSGMQITQNLFSPTTPNFVNWSFIKIFFTKVLKVLGKSVGG